MKSLKTCHYCHLRSTTFIKAIKDGDVFMGDFKGFVKKFGKEKMSSLRPSPSSLRPSPSSLRPSPSSLRRQGSIPEIDLKSGLSTVIYLKPNTHISDPITIPHIIKTNDQCNLIIILDKNSSCSIFDYRKSLKKVSHKQITQIYLSKNSKLNFFSLINLDKKSDCITSFNNYLENSSCLNSYIAPLSGKNINLNLKNYFIGEKANSETKILSYSNEKQTSYIGATDFFKAQNCDGKIEIKSVASESSIQKIEGLINIDNKASKTNSFLEIKGIILGPKAGINALPNLVINTNDVKVGHSASVTNIKNDEIFYMISRGIPLPQAKQLSVDGFIEDFFEKKFPFKSIKKAFKHVIKIKQIGSNK